MAKRKIESRIEVRPTLIVGIGGTGALTLQHTYDLLDQLPGGLPPFIKFVALDTDRQEEGGPRKLPAEDFFNLFEDLELGEVIRDFKREPGFHEHLRWLKDMKLDAGAAGCGCQGLNRLGRAVFFELRERIHQIVAARLAALNDTDALQRMMEPFEDRYVLGRGSAPEIHVAGSVCGGTGAGMIIDLAYNLRFWANDEFHKNPDVISHLVLPEAFPVNSERIKDKLRTVAFATLEQIELLTDGERRDLPVKYPNNTTKYFERLTAPFDYIYLLSGTAPGRGTDRRHITQMIARMIRAMAAEPASAPIFADANNKQLDILTQRAESNKRRLCFASYGLRYGISGTISNQNHGESHSSRQQQKQDLVQRWVCEMLQHVALASGMGRATAEHEKEMDRALNNAFDLDILASQIPNKSAFNYSNETQPENKTREQHLGEVLTAFLDRQKQTVLEAVRTLLPKVVKEEVIRPITQGWQEILDDPESDVSELAGYLSAWQTRIDQRRRQERERSISHFENAKSRAMAAVQKALIQKAQIVNPQFPDLESIDLQDIDTVANRSLSAQFRELAKPIIHAEFDRVLLDASRQVANRLRLLGYLGDSAKERLGDLGGADGGLNLVNEYFAMPLFKLENPSKTNVEKLKLLRSEFHQRFIVPVVKKFLVRPEGSEMPGIPEARDQFVAILRDLSEEMEQFLTSYERSYKSVFRQPLGTTRPSDHLFYEPVRRIDERTEAQIAINQKRRFNDTLDVVVSQHPAGTCIPELLAANAHRSHRPAITDDNEDSKIWFQLHKFRYGFCLPALDDYDEYVKATERYVGRTDFKPTDFWLDPDWHRDYLKLVARCRVAAAPGDTATAADEANPAEVLAEIRENHEYFYRTVDADIDAHKDQLSNPGNLVDYYEFRNAAVNGLREANPIYLDEANRKALKLAESAAASAGTLHPDILPAAEEALKDLQSACGEVTQRDTAGPEQRPKETVASDE